MKKFIAVLQTASGFTTWTGKASTKESAREQYKHIGVTVSLVEYSQHNFKMAQLVVSQLKTLAK
jgi:hypothetical protein